jgi:hypothetical protein
MATYTAVYNITISADIEADSYEEAERIAEGMTRDEILDGQYIEDYWPEFDKLLEN